jgi:hypothetical protein
MDRTEMAGGREGRKVTQLLPGGGQASDVGRSRPVTLTRRKNAAWCGQRLSGRKKIDRVQGRDNLTTHHQLLEVIAIAQIFVPEDSAPEIIKIFSDGVGSPGFEEGGRIEHTDFFSNACATPPGGGNPKSQNPKS